VLLNSKRRKVALGELHQILWTSVSPLQTKLLVLEHGIWMFHRATEQILYSLKESSKASLRR